MMASRGGERRTGRGKADRTPGGKRGGGGAGVRTSRGKATSSATRRLKRVAAAVGEAGEATPEVPQRENDARREDARARGGGAPDASAQPAEVGTRAASRWSSTPTGVRFSLDALTVDVAQAEIERGELKAVVSVRRGDELVYSERVTSTGQVGETSSSASQHERSRRRVSRLISLRLFWRRCAPRSEGGRRN